MKVVDYRETLVTYLRSESLDDAAHSLGVSKAALQQRLHTLKKAGVAVPKNTKRGGVVSNGRSPIELAY